MNGIERMNGEAKAPEWQRFGDLLLAWKKSGDLSDELAPLLVALGLVEWQGDGPVLTETSQSLRLLLRSLANVPVYDAGSGALCWRGRVVKTVPARAARQRAALEAFELAGWQRLLDGPPLLALRLDCRQLRRTVRGLNKGVAPGTIRFHIDGRGRGILWSPLGG